MNDKIIDKPEWDEHAEEVLREEVAARDEAAETTPAKKGFVASLRAMDFQMKLIVGAACLVGVGLLFVMLDHVSKTGEAMPQDTPASTTSNLTPTADFGLPQEQQSIESKLLTNEDANSSAEQQKLTDLQSQQTQQDSTIAQLQSKLQAQLDSINNANLNKTPATPNNPGLFSAPHIAPLGGAQGAQGSATNASAGSPMQTFSLSYADSGSQQGGAYNTYVPSGTFVRAVLLGGADASTAVGSQGDTTPIVFRLLDQGTEANGKKSILKNCIATGQAYGDISSERGMVRLDRLSCNFPDGSTLDVPVHGTAYDIGGKDGIRGIKVLRNGPILTMSFISGLAQGFGQAFQNAQTTQTPNIAGTTSTTVSPSSSLAYAGLGGMSAAAQNLSNYYIGLANQYHPIIELNAGAQVDILFTAGFSTNPTQTNTTPNNTQSADDAQTNPYGFASAPQTQSWQQPTSQQGALPLGMQSGQALPPMTQSSQQEQ